MMSNITFDINTATKKLCNSALHRVRAGARVFRQQDENQFNNIN